MKKKNHLEKKKKKKMFTPGEDKSISNFTFNEKSLQD